MLNAGTARKYAFARENSTQRQPFREVRRPKTSDEIQEIKR
jgi:hypothetical protein